MDLRGQDSPPHHCFAAFDVPVRGSTERGSIQMKADVERVRTIRLRKEAVESFLGGIRAQLTEQWDQLRCPAGCGEFEYRHRTRKLRQISTA
jgi:hypothetical protein